jgi:hypothetical protein
MIPVVLTIQKLIGIAKDDDNKIQMQWSRKLRGFRNKENCQANNKDSNYALLDPIDCVVKEQVVLTLTKFQRVDIWDLVGSWKNHPPMPLPYDMTTRHLFLDGVLQSKT